MRSVFCFDLHFLRGAASVKRGTAGALKELTILCLAAVLALPACSRISSSDGVQANSALPSAEQAAVAVPIIPIAEVVRNIEGGCVTKGEAVPEGSMQIGLRKHEDMPVIAKLVRETQTEGTPFAAKIKELVGVTIGDPYTIISTDRLQETRVVRFEWNELWEVLTVVVQPAKEPADDVLLYRGAALPAAVRLHKVVNLAADPAYQDAMRKVVEYVTANTPLKHRKGLNWLGVDVDDITYIRGNFGGGIHGHVIVNASENRQTGFSRTFSARLVLDAAANVVGFTRAPAILDEWDELEQLKYVVDVNGDGIDELLDYSGNSIGGCDFLKYWDGTTTASKKLGCWSEA